MLLKPTGYVIFYPLSFVEDDKLRPRRMKRPPDNFQKFDEEPENVRVKIADLAGRWNQKGGEKK